MLLVGELIVYDPSGLQTSLLATSPSKRDHKMKVRSCTQLKSPGPSSSMQLAKKTK
jgi:hypothetical protein